jgi:hypothetical protein
VREEKKVFICVEGQWLYELTETSAVHIINVAHPFTQYLPFDRSLLYIKRCQKEEERTLMMAETRVLASLLDVSFKAQ